MLWTKSLILLTGLYLSQDIKMHKKEEINDEQFFVGISGTKDLRRNLLESSREVVHSLQSYEKISEIREEKLRRIRQFKTVIEELKLLISKLNESVPQVRIKQPVSKNDFKLPKKKKEPVSKKRKDEIEEMRELEEDLSKIEGRLAQLK